METAYAKQEYYVSLRPGGERDEKKTTFTATGRETQRARNSRRGTKTARKKDHTPSRSGESNLKKKKKPIPLPVTAKENRPHGRRRTSGRGKKRCLLLQNGNRNGEDANKQQAKKKKNM